MVEPAGVAAVVIPVTFGVSKQISTMRHFSAALALVSLALLSACSTPETRIADRRAVFDALPAEVQQKIRGGKVEIGFTPDMVRMALGEPARIFMRQTETGATEVWIYHDEGPHFGLGIGIGSGGYHSAVGGGLALLTGADDPDEKVRVVYRDGRVSEIETAKR